MNVYATLFAMAKRQKQPKCPSMGEQINKIHAVEYYLAIKRKEVLARSKTWMKLENTVLSERSQTRKVT